MDCGLEGLTFTSPSLCKPEFAQELDLRNIIARFLRTGQLPQMRDDAGITDATKLPQSFQELQDGVASIRQQFEQLPESERMKYGNDIDTWLQAQEEGKEVDNVSQVSRNETESHEQSDVESSKEVAQEG